MDNRRPSLPPPKGGISERKEFQSNTFPLWGE